MFFYEVGNGDEDRATGSVGLEDESSVSARCLAWSMTARMVAYWVSESTSAEHEIPVDMIGSNI